MNKFRVSLSMTMAVLWLSSCASDPIYVNYSHPSEATGDWYPIPADANTRVEVSDPDVPRVALSEPPVVDEDDSVSALAIDRLIDSLGNETLLFNRRPGTVWELMDTALSSVELPVTDRNRDEYQFELTLGEGNRGLFSMFQSPERLNLILIPQDNDTIVAIEDENGEVPDPEEAGDILDKLLDYFQNQG